MSGTNIQAHAKILTTTYIMETIASEAASLGFEVNWQKTKVQALGCREDMPLTIKVQAMTSW